MKAAFGDKLTSESSKLLQIHHHGPCSGRLEHSGLLHRTSPPDGSTVETVGTQRRRGSVLSRSTTGKPVYFHPQGQGVLLLRAPCGCRARGEDPVGCGLVSCKNPNGAYVGGVRLASRVAMHTVLLEPGTPRDPFLLRRESRKLCPREKRRRAMPREKTTMSPELARLHGELKKCVPSATNTVGMYVFGVARALLAHAEAVEAVEWAWRFWHFSAQIELVAACYDCEHWETNHEQQVASKRVGNRVAREAFDRIKMLEGELAAAQRELELARRHF